MLELRPSHDMALIRDCCAKCRKVPGPQFYLYRATSSDECLAAALFEVESERVVVRLYEGPPDDSWLFDAVLRAGLNYAAEQGIINGCLPEEFRQKHAQYFSGLNYPAQAVFNITNFFSKYKRCAL